MNSIGIYIHWPFCEKKCPYCDFNSYVKQNINPDEWVNSYCKAIDYYKNYIIKRPIETIFFGGGTPSLAPVYVIEKIINKLYKEYVIHPNIEITLEANPSSTESAKMKDLKRAGINRISLGIQSIRNNNLIFLGRKHNVNDAYHALDIIANNYDNYSFDLIYGLPEQSLDDWKLDLETMLPLAKYHISLYQLVIEPGTQFHKMWLNNIIKMPDENQLADFYNLTNEITIKNEFRHYEISNYCKIDKESKHNLRYWRYQDYLGIGPGAHSRFYNYTKISDCININDINNNIISKNDINNNIISKNDINNKNTDFSTRIATIDHKNPEKWLQSVKKYDHGINDIEYIDCDIAKKEEIIMKMRLLNEGIEINKCSISDSVLKELKDLDLIKIQKKYNIYDKNYGKKDKKNNLCTKLNFNKKENKNVINVNNKISNKIIASNSIKGNINNKILKIDSMHDNEINDDIFYIMVTDRGSAVLDFVIEKLIK
ncbi:radical SAM family heme chaperone HemW [Lyticum sinuosum]|uniref:Heme chaperone HemW n=1 Tax=Lyticum sinuosum TaxID=1332059 RepID=A0AAE4VL75_9RICK|nr:radical SAM family heme chaperone HemW [Lyticum sinuosum]MDZ5761242.1 Oxygen-independent coproporphyrinogen-III oxidase [Lyticum sinuosum]